MTKRAPRKTARITVLDPIEPVDSIVIQEVAAILMASPDGDHLPAADTQVTLDASTPYPYQPVTDIQLNQLKIEWRPRDSIRPNTYNPNTMTAGDRRLLRQSLLEDGWTQPIVILPNSTIVDGEQRWTIAGEPIKPDTVQAIIDKMLKRRSQGASISESILSRLTESLNRLRQAIAVGMPATIASITGGLVPITVLDLGDDAHSMISTIRHNRARGTHQIDAMADITHDLVQLGLDIDDIEQRLGMDEEEITRFLKRSEGQVASLEAELSGLEFSEAWQPVHISELTDESSVLFERSAAANQAIKEHQIKLAERERLIAQRTEALALSREAESGKALTQTEREGIEDDVAAEIPIPDRPGPVILKKLIFFVTPDEHKLIVQALGDYMAARLVELCRESLSINPPQAQA